MRVLFLVQGEGRGHMTQALALAPALRRAGHDLVAVLVGSGPDGSVPTFFEDEIGAPVERFEEPSFVFGARGLSPVRTALGVARRLRPLRAARHVVEAAVRRHRPDVVVSFFTFVAGRLGRLGVPVVCIGHQYAFHHPVYPFPPGRDLAVWGARFWTDRTAPPGARRLALSFYPAAEVPGKNLRMVPPLLRESVLSLAPADDGHVLVYLMRPEMAEAVEAWALRRPDVRAHVFWSRPDAPETLVKAPNLTFHRLSGTRFVEHLGRCRAVVCTAGFETVSEAMLLGKPALMVPIGRHFEQTVNARDAEAAGAGLHTPALTPAALDRLLDHARAHRPVTGFRAWAESAPSLVVAEIERAARVVPSAHRRPRAA